MKRQEQEMKTEKKQFEFSDAKHSSFTLNKDFKKNRGLRELSFHVKEIIQRDGNSSYKRVADALIKTQRVRGRCEVANVRRRVYDALNVLISVGLIQKEKQSKSLLSTQDNTSRGKCLYRDRWKRLKEMKKDRELIMQSIQIKKKYIKQTAASICKMDALVKKNGYNIDLTSEKEMIQKGEQQIAIPFSQQSYQDFQQQQDNRLQFPILMFWNDLSQLNKDPSVSLPYIQR
ncbi:hypothetical protein pb186bvf_002123 [Paramecium bursaria]